MGRQVPTRLSPHALAGLARTGPPLDPERAVTWQPPRQQPVQVFPATCTDTLRRRALRPCNLQRCGTLVEVNFAVLDFPLLRVPTPSIFFIRNQLLRRFEFSSLEILRDTWLDVFGKKKMFLVFGSQSISLAWPALCPFGALCCCCKLGRHIQWPFSCAILSIYICFPLRHRYHGIQPCTVFRRSARRRFGIRNAYYGDKNFQAALASFGAVFKKPKGPDNVSARFELLAGLALLHTHHLNPSPLLAALSPAQQQTLATALELDCQALAFGADAS